MVVSFTFKLCLYVRWKAIERTEDFMRFHSCLFKILQNEQLDEISPMGNEEVSAVSQAWFTTKEDKDSLTNKGRTLKFSVGM